MYGRFTATVHHCVLRHRAYPQRNHCEEVNLIQEYLTQRKGVTVKVTVPQRGTKKELLDLALKNAKYAIENTQLKEVQTMLNLPSEPVTIECFDISNLGSEHVVAGMTQFVNGRPNKDGYRQFEIQVTKIKGVQDDFASMYEAVYRRYKLQSRRYVP